MVWRKIFGAETQKFKVNVQDEEPFFRVYLERRRGVASLPSFLQESERTFGDECHSRQEATNSLGYFSENWNCHIYKRRGVLYCIFPEFVPDEVGNWLRKRDKGKDRRPETVSKLFGYSETEAEILMEYSSESESETAAGALAVKVMELAEKSDPPGIIKQVEISRTLGTPPDAVGGCLENLEAIGAAECYEEDGEVVYVIKDLARLDKLNVLRIMRLKAVKFLTREEKRRDLMEEAYRDRLRVARRAEKRTRELEAEVRKLSRHIQSLEAERQTLVDLGRLSTAQRIKEREIQLFKSKKNLEEEIQNQENFVRDLRNYKIELLEQKIKIDKITRLIKDLELKVKIAQSIPAMMEKGESVEEFIDKTRKYLEEEYKEIEELEREILGIEEEELITVEEIPEEILEEMKRVEREVRVVRQRTPLLEKEEEEL